MVTVTAQFDVYSRNPASYFIFIAPTPSKKKLASFRSSLDLLDWVI